MSSELYSVVMAGASLCPNTMSPKISTPAMYVFGIVICALELPMAVFTVLGNCCVIYVIYRCPSLHRNHNYMIVTAAATDLITGLVTQPLCVTTILQESSRMSTALAAFNLLGNLTSLLALMMLSLERVLAVKLPFWYKTHVTGGCLRFSLSSRHILPPWHTRPVCELASCFEFYPSSLSW